LALIKAGHLHEAEIYLNELLREDPNTGPANLGLGRVRFQQQEIRQAVSYFHRAVYGSWPRNAPPNRVEIRTELIDGLRKANANKQAQAELMALASELPADPTVQKKTGRLFLDLGMPKVSADTFREVLQTGRADAEAYSGVGAAELAMANFPAAQSAFRSAARLDPASAAYRKQLQLVEQTMAMDSAIRGLRAADRYQRSQKLLEAAAGSLEQCLAASPAKLEGPQRNAADAARKVLLRHGRPQSYSSAAESSISLAGQVWESRVKLCGPPTPAEEPLSRANAHVSQ
jgi:tetratricopeptide (TPR) repeat protein